MWVWGLMHWTASSSLVLSSKFLSSVGVCGEEVMSNRPRSFYDYSLKASHGL